MLSVATVVQQIIIIITIIIIIIVPAIELSLGGSTDKTNQIKYTQTKQNQNTVQTIQKNSKYKHIRAPVSIDSVYTVYRGGKKMGKVQK
jgi:hypothetical protein